MAISAPNSPVDVCNLALTQLKQDLITNIDEPESPAENLCNLWYEQVRQQTLRQGVWNFAIKRFTINPNATPPLFGFTNAYDLPPDFIRYLSRHDAQGATVHRIEDGIDYQIENGQILLNSASGSTLRVRYIFDQTVVQSFDPLFIDLLAVNLAIKLAPNFSASEARMNNLAALRDDIKAEAMAIDGQERPPRRFESSKWRLKRRQGSTGVAGPNTNFE